VEPRHASAIGSQLEGFKVVKNFAFLLALGVGGSAFASSVTEASPCVAASLASYTDTYGAGSGNFCQIGSLVYSDFFFADITGVASISASDLIVTPDFASSSFSLIPSLANPNVLNQNFLNFERYYFAWFVDPPPPIIGGDELSLDPPDANVAAYKWGCAGTDAPGTFSTSNENAVALLGELGSSPLTDSTFSCSGRGFEFPFPVSYFLETSAPGNLTDSTTFPGVSTIDVRMVLDMGPGQVNDFLGITGGHAIVDPIPEPATNAMIAAGLVALIGLSRKNSKR